MNELDDEIERATEYLEDVLRNPQPNKWKRQAEQRYSYLRGLLNARHLVTGKTLQQDNERLYDRVSRAQDWASTRGVD